MTELRQRQPRILDPGFIRFTQKLACCVCKEVGRSQAAHIRMANDELKKPPAGMQEKPSDMFCVPLCGPRLGAYPAVIGCHAIQHSMNERDFWDIRGIDPFMVASWNYTVYSAQKKPVVQGERKTKKRASRKLPSRPFSKQKRKFRNA